MLSIKFTSCYPNGTRLNNQIAKIAEEYSEVILADTHRRCNGEWEDLFHELLDLSQVAVGAMEILLDDNCRGNQNIKYEILERLLEEHQQKLRSRRKEWCGDNGGD